MKDAARRKVSFAFHGSIKTEVLPPGGLDNLILNYSTAHNRTIHLLNMVVPADKPYFPLNGVANDGWSNEEEATATCFCGAVQLAFVRFKTFSHPFY